MTDVNDFTYPPPFPQFSPDLTFAEWMALVEDWVEDMREWARHHHHVHHRPSVSVTISVGATSRKGRH